eukprot:713763-Pelagomonas_calceolata.AAC.1
MLSCCTFESDERILVRAEFQFNKVFVGSPCPEKGSWKDQGLTKRTSGRLWCRAGEPVPLGENQSGIALEMFSGTP